MPIVLKIGFEDLVAEVILRLTARLLIVGDIPRQHVCERTTSRLRECRGVKGNKAVQRGLELGQFVFLGSNEIPAELQVVLADDLGDVIAVSVARIRVYRSVGDVTRVL